MEISFRDGIISFNKELTELDVFVRSFVDILDKEKLRYVLISGYVSILFGRNRSSEDVDLFLESLSEKEFNRLWRSLAKRFVCLNTENCAAAYHEYLQNGIAIRFADENAPLPNMEVKFPKHDVDRWQLAHHQKVLVNGKPLSISTLESQIAFKLLLGSDKDFEDARYLYKLFEKHLNKEGLHSWCKRLDVTKRMAVLQ